MTTTRALLWNVVLAFIWAAATANLTLTNLAAGFILGYVALLLARGAVGPSDYFSKVSQLGAFLLFFTWEIIISTARVARHVISPRLRAQPGVIGIPLDTRDEAEIALFATLLTLTPGTLSLEVSDDRSTLYVHVMSVDNRDELQQKIKESFERRIVELLA